MAEEYEHLEFADAAAFEAWLAEHGGEVAGIRLRIAKKASGIETVNHSDAIDVALCHGWIDGRRNGLDEHYFLQTFTPRRPRSLWSKINQERVAALIEAGRMRDAGLREIERARADGRWDAAYASPKNIEVPPELAAALAASPVAEARFAELTGQRRFQILFTLHNLKREETRTRRIAQYVAELAGERADARASEPSGDD
ncbi:YdeI/OmpD-associated family protein [Herbiconiux moechotypicola]|uniref:YdeI/OmpD-associated family protein n=1 Tax=Herbiconiux moechotypicola TaxID=637393 RepID=A0ABN3DTT5_9MICO|nr:YdeI/OmpD-associated family protein [Herbiconiux moechotypicola]MCS5730504.1 YdeI/OmpD-associated family protein [Herbiconiux moechotypicola]